MAQLFDASPLKSGFTSRISTARTVLQTGEATKGIRKVDDISRETRGVAIVLLYAAYENLLKGTCRTLLEGARMTRATNGRFRPGIRVFAAHRSMQSLADIGPNAMWRGKAEEISTVLSSRAGCTIDVNAFPKDGSNMKREQVQTLCSIFGLSHPASILREVWEDIDGIVTQRNAIAHGQNTPEEIGRRYSYDDLKRKLALWDQRWLQFLDWVEAAAIKREFYLLPR